MPSGNAKVLRLTQEIRKKHTFLVDTCPGCIGTIGGAIKNSVGFKDRNLEISFGIKKKYFKKYLKVSISFDSKSDSFSESNYNEAEIQKLLTDILEEYGYIYISDKEFVNENNIYEQLQKYREAEKKQSTKIPLNLIKTVAAFLVASGLLLLCMLNVFLPFFAIAAIIGASCLLISFLGFDIYKEELERLFSKRKIILNMNSLFFISTTAIMVIVITSLFFPLLSPLMLCMDLFSIVFFWYLGKIIKDKMGENSNSSFHFIDNIPNEISILENGAEKKIPIGLLKQGNIVIVKENETIPVDGTCGNKNDVTLYSERRGNTFSFNPIRGDTIVAGTEVKRGTAYVSASVTSNDYIRLDDLIEEISENKSTIKTFIDKLLKVFISIVILSSITTFLVLFWFVSLPLTLICAVSILVYTCPCVLGLLIPTLIKVGVTKLCKDKIELDATALENAATIDTFIFDFRGTITQGKLKVKQLILFDEYGSDERLTKEAVDALYSLEKTSEDQNDFARIICEHLKKFGPKLEEVTQLDTSNHSGITGIINNKTYLVGNKKMLEDSKLDITHIPALEDSEATTYFVCNGKIIAALDIQDQIRNDVSTINKLRSMGKKIRILSGERKAVVLSYIRKFANEDVISNDDIIGDLEDSEKVNEIKKLQDAGYIVAMVGDGRNDVPAQHICLGIVIDRKNDRRLHDNNIIIRDESLKSILKVLYVSKQVKTQIKINLAINTSYNLLGYLGIGFLVFFGFAAPVLSVLPALGMLAMTLQLLIIALNMWRTSQQKIPEIQLKEYHNPDFISSSYGAAIAPNLTRSPSPSDLNNRRETTPILTPSHSSATASWSVGQHLPEPVEPSYNYSRWHAI